MLKILRSAGLFVGRGGISPKRSDIWGKVGGAKYTKPKTSIRLGAKEKIILFRYRRYH